MHLEGIKSSGLKNASAAIVARPCLLHSITIIPAAAASTAIAYDNASAGSGTEIGYAGGVANGASVSQVFVHPVECLNGIYVAVTGTSAQYIVTYSLL